jgi:hypothetical protein
MLAACGDAGPAFAPESASLAVGDGPLRLTGSGHHTRTVGTETEPTTFSFSAVRQADGSTTGRYQYDFRAAGFAIHGSVTCLTTDGVQAWVGGVVDQVLTDDPSFEAQLLGVDMWWRSKDLGEGTISVDSTTGLGFKFATTAITAESWCRDKPASLVMRAVENGNIQLVE